MSLNIDHTFLFQDGLWVAAGTFIDKDNNAIPVEGSNRIMHTEGLWLNKGYMKLLMPDGKAIELQNNYRITPFESGKLSTVWESHNPSLGKLFGKFVVVDDSIISTFTSENNEFSGAEYLLKITDINYRARGFAMQGSTRLSSWSAELLLTNQALH